MLADARERTRDLLVATEALRLRSVQIRHESARLHRLVALRPWVTQAAITPGGDAEVGGVLLPFRRRSPLLPDREE
jgi:hypothetical protein